MAGKIASRTVSLLLVLLMLFSSIGIVWSISTESQEALMESVQDELMSVAGTTASQIDGDAFSRIQVGSEGTPEYLAIRDQLRQVKMAVPDILYIYTMQNDDGLLEFVVDADYGYADDASLVGDAYPEAEPEMYMGFEGLSADEEFTTDQWGTVLSGFAPIHDSSGNVVGIVGVDMDSSVILEEIDYLNTIFYGAVFGVMVAGALGFFFIERRRVIAERKIAVSEKKYRQLFEQAGDCILIFEAEGKDAGRIVSANRAAAMMHGYSTDELLTMRISDLDSPESRVGAGERMQRVLGGEEVRGEVTHVRKDGTTFPMEINGSLLLIDAKKMILAIDRDISERKHTEKILELATKKQNLLNLITFSDIKNAMFSLRGYIELEKEFMKDGQGLVLLEKEEALIQQVEHWIRFAKDYQNLGAVPPTWQNVTNAYLYAISHLDTMHLHQSSEVEGLEVYADSLLETVFYTLVENSLEHGESVTEITLTSYETEEGLTIVFQDNGIGIPAGMKETIFDRRHEKKKGMSLFLVREILEITGIAIVETGLAGEGVRFEMHVPLNHYRHVARGDGHSPSNN
ncbi:hypothetical protein AZH53_00365 [Methanomicrobiaceae archaeon CYW5]|uniref:PAS domain S-box protein n=1 Tax=Methanovulcanius yangii TaxID=1789227 RepID=UPI0029CA26B8|nr:PAS domain S-box protein [Methanovulcanius yangii]MBT8506882.1 hypothetical protein [Methanovulcanius yangii]